MVDKRPLSFELGDAKGCHGAIDLKMPALLSHAIRQLAGLQCAANEQMFLGPGQRDIKQPPILFRITGIARFCRCFQ